MDVDGDMPFLSSFGKFLLGTLALQIDLPCRTADKRLRHGKQPRQGCQSPCCDDVGLDCIVHLFDATGMNCDARTGRTCGLAKKLRLATIALNEVDLRNTKNREDQARQASTAAKIDQDVRIPRQERQNLGRIGNMPPPGIDQGRWSNKIDCRLPTAEQVEIGCKPLACFT